MRESFVLKRHGKLTLQEQAVMTAEERKWWIKELEREFERENEKMKSAQSSKPEHIPVKIPDCVGGFGLPLLFTPKINR
jgi:hypothetical protein